MVVEEGPKSTCCGLLIRQTDQTTGNMMSACKILFLGSPKKSGSDGRWSRETDELVIYYSCAYLIHTKSRREKG